MVNRTFEEYLIILAQRAIDYPQYPAEYLTTKIEKLNGKRFKNNA